MEIQYVRILSIRKHKTITFINGYNDSLGNIQFLIDNDLANQINCGDLILGNIVDDLNKKGIPVKRIEKIYKIIKSYDFQSYKGIKDSISFEKENVYFNMRNCGSQLNLFFYKRELLNKIKDILDSLRYLDMTSLLNTVEYYANGSQVKEAVIEDRSINQNKYLRITLENQLKQATAALLKSTYAIEKVFRNMGEDNSHINEFLMLELVSIENDMNIILNFIKNIDALSKDLARKYNINYKDYELQILDYSDIPSDNFELTKKEFKNTIITNFPCSSPLIYTDSSGNKTETRWYVKGHFISHFYQDENRYNLVRETLKLEQEKKNEKINQLDYIKWGIPNSVSLGLSIDRWLQMLLDLQNINIIANPLGLDFPVRERTRK